MSSKRARAAAHEGESADYTDGEEEAETGSGLPKKKTKTYRASHNAIEKRRRDRINGSLKSLAEMVPECSVSQSRLDKADILKMTVDYLVQLRSGELKIGPAPALSTSMIDNFNGGPNLRFSAPENGDALSGWIKQLFDERSEILHVFSAKGELLYLAGAVASILGCQSSELTGKTIFELIHPEDVGQLLEIISNISPQHKGVQTLSYRMQKKGGSYVWLSARGRVITNEKNSPVQFIGCGREFNAPQLSHSAGILNSIESNEFLCRQNYYGILTYASASCKTLTGHNPLELVGKSTYTFYHPEDVRDMCLANSEANTPANLGQVVTKKCRFAKKDGTYIWILSKLVAVVNPVTQAPDFLLSVNRVLNANGDGFDYHSQLNRIQLNQPLEPENACLMVDNILKLHLTIKELERKLVAAGIPLEESIKVDMAPTEHILPPIARTVAPVKSESTPTALFDIDLYFNSLDQEIGATGIEPPASAFDDLQSLEMFSTIL